MSTNGFREDELVSRKVKVGNEWQTKVFPIIGGRLRILHETNDSLSIQTEIVRLDNDFAVVKAAVENRKGRFNGTGTASAQRDARLADSLVELAETRAIARALRFGGIGVEYTGAEEVSHVTAAEPEKEQTFNKEPAPVFPAGNGNGNGKTKPKASRDAIDPTGTEQAKGPQAAEEGSRPQPQRCGSGPVTAAQVRALYALTKRARYHPGDIASLLAPFQVSRFEDLPREAASQLIGYIQQEIAA